MAYTDQVVDLLATLTLFGNIIVLVLLGGLLTGRRITRSAFPAMLVVAATATMGSLFLSEIAGWVPCKLCWFQRIFMYPQVPLLLIAFWKRDHGIASYIVVLCLIGIAFSATHYTEQLSAMLWPDPVDPLKPCDASGVSCAATPIFRYGYITVPMMALTAFLMNMLIALGVMRTRKKE